MTTDYKFETDAIRQQIERSQHREHSAPLYLTSSFVFDSAEQARAMFAEEIDMNKDRQNCSNILHHLSTCTIT